jgi:hypothetical protein
MDEVKVPEANFLPHVAGLKGPFSCLNSARYATAFNLVAGQLFELEVIFCYNYLNYNSCIFLQFYCYDEFTSSCFIKKVSKRKISSLQFPKVIQVIFKKRSFSTFYLQLFH